MKGIPVILLLAALVFLAAVGAGIYAWTVAIAGVLLCGGYAMLAWRAARSVPHPPYPGRFRGVEIVLLLAAAYVALMLLPLPAPLTRLVSPGRWQDDEQVRLTLQAAETAGLSAPAPAFFSLTRNRAGTLRMTLLGIAAVGAALLASLADPRRKRFYVRTLLLLGVGLAAAAYVSIRVRPQGDTLWWIHPIPRGLPGPLVCFVNRNHLAGYLAMLAASAFGLCVSDLSARRGLGAILAAAACAAMTAAIVLSGSRGGLVALAGGVTASAAVLAARRRPKVLAWTVVTAALLVAALVRLPGPAFRERMRPLLAPVSSGEFQDRLDAWRDSFQIWRAYPVLGAGPNAFRAVYPRFRRTSRSDFLAHAENEYVQALAETGLAGVVGLALALALAWRHARPADGPSDGADAFLVPCAAGALGAAAAHAGCEFALRAPLYTITLASLVGLCLRRPDTGLALRAASRRVPWPALAGALAALAILPFHGPLNTLDSHAGALRITDLDLARRAVIGAPTAWYAWFALGRAACARGGAPAARFGERCLARAAELDPNNYRLWRELGILRLELRDYAGARAAFARTRKLRHWARVPVVPEDAP